MLTLKCCVSLTNCFIVHPSFLLYIIPGAGAGVETVVVLVKEAEGDTERLLMLLATCDLPVCER